MRVVHGFRVGAWDALGIHESMYCLPSPENTNPNIQVAKATGECSELSIINGSNLTNTSHYSDLDPRSKARQQREFIFFSKVSQGMFG